MQPIPYVNGDINKNKGYEFQYQPSDHPDWATAEYPRNLKEYKDNEVLYQVNEQSFRSVSFNKSDNALMSAGCSHTYGIGQRDKERWGYQTAQEVDLVNWNIGCGGIGADVVALLIRQFFEEGYIPKVLCVLWPPHERALLRLEKSKTESPMGFNFIHPVWQWLPNKDNDDVDPNMYDVQGIKTATKSHLLKSNVQMLHEYWIARQSVIDLCKIHNVQLVEMFSTFEARDYIKETCTQNIPTSPLVLGTGVKQGDESDYAWDLARDGMHFGFKSNQYIAKEFVSQINLDQL
tara:strand:- start:658 stop:1530 length:873 start_codon:yes stop_codon:yes gene_type:complete